MKVNAMIYAKLIGVIVSGPCSSKDAAEETGLHITTVREYFKALHKERLIHICAYLKDSLGRECEIVFAWGDKADVKRNSATHAERQQRVRDRKRAAKDPRGFMLCA